MSPLCCMKPSNSRLEAIGWSFSKLCHLSLSYLCESPPPPRRPFSLISFTATRAHYFPPRRSTASTVFVHPPTKQSQFTQLSLFCLSLGLSSFAGIESAPLLDDGRRRRRRGGGGRRSLPAADSSFPFRRFGRSKSKLTQHAAFLNIE